MDLHLVYVPSHSQERNEEYCVCLRSDSVYTELSVDAAEEALQPCGLATNKVNIVQHELEHLTYKTLLRAASSLAAPSNLQVVLNSDIVLADWPDLGSCLPQMHSRKRVFHMSRTEP